MYLLVVEPDCSSEVPQSWAWSHWYNSSVWWPRNIDYPSAYVRPKGHQKSYTHPLIYTNAHTPLHPHCWFDNYIANVPFQKETGKWSANGIMCVVSQVAIDANSQLSECWNLTVKHSLSKTWDSSECKWFNSTSKWLHELLRHKQSCWEWGDMVLNDYNAECFPVRLSSSTKINLRMWFSFKLFLTWLNTNVFHL